LQPIVDLAPGTEDNPLAARLAARVRDNALGRPAALADFRALRGTVLVVAQDTTATVTLRFDHGRLTVHDGAVGVPAVTFCGDEADLLRLGQLPIAPLVRLPLPLPGDPAGRRALRTTVGGLASGRLKVYGLLVHPRLVLRFLRLVSDRG
jgi:hypothetical protein